VRGSSADECLNHFPQRDILSKRILRAGGLSQGNY
jgi:hypothetical protein